MATAGTATAGMATAGTGKGYHGVTLDAKRGAWVATLDGCFLGFCRSEEEAARRYDEHAQHHHKPLNFPAAGAGAMVRSATVQAAVAAGKFTAENSMTVKPTTNTSEKNNLGLNMGTIEAVAPAAGTIADDRSEAHSAPVGDDVDHFQAPLFGTLERGEGGFWGVTKLADGNGAPRFGTVPLPFGGSQP
jgi:hypothetical protein